MVTAASPMDVTGVGWLTGAGRLTGAGQLTLILGGAGRLMLVAVHTAWSRAVDDGRS